MKNKFIFCALGAFIFLAIIGMPDSASAAVNLTVPYIKEVPAGTSGGPWKNACEEASFTMLEKYYTGKKVMNLAEGKAMMTMFFNKENILYGSNVNSDTAQSKYLINTYTDYNAKIIDNPTIAQIKSEIDAGRPVITPHYGFDLHNPNIPFLRTGTSYHMMVITGYDDAARQFIVNDPGDTVDGQGYRYGYDLFMGTIHDYSYKTKKANGPARAIFTYPKLVKVAGSPRIYYLHDNIWQYITAPSVFVNHHWKWEAVNTVSAAWLKTFQSGPAINK
ncbi:MAG: C39 family peptidase [Patescibacteria group bacterium]|nr:C39 family peptidase [Patescibacteria group bacterium]